MPSRDLNDLPLVGGGQGHSPEDVTASGWRCAAAIALLALLFTVAVVRAWGSPSSPRPARETRAVSVHVEEAHP